MTESERTPEARRKAEDTYLRFAEMVESSDDAIVGKTLQGIVQTWNAAAEKMYGYAAREIIGQPIGVLVPHDRAAEEVEILSRIRRGERVRHIETVRLRKDGAAIHVSLTISPIRNRGGEVVGASHVARDITQRVEYERTMALLAAIVESSDDAIVGKDLNGVIQSWNSGAEQLDGYPREEAIGRSMTLLLPPDRPDEEAETLERIREGKRVQHFETVRLRKDGSRINVSLTVSPIQGKSGEVIGASDVARNITERKKVEAAAAQLSAVVASSNDAIVSKNLDGDILTWNAGAERIYGYSADEMKGRSMVILLPPDRAHEEAAILKRLNDGARVEHFETIRVRKDGKHIHVSLTISPIRDSSGTVRGASHIARDITERKAFENELRQTQKLESLGVLAGGIAHDFNNLLTGILGNASLLMDAFEPEDANYEFAASVVKAAERAAGLTRQLLAYAGKAPLLMEAINLSDLVREIIELVHMSIPRKVEVRLELPDQLPAIDGDAGQLQQVVMNLVINAAEAIGDQTGTVRVVTGVEDVDEEYVRMVFSGEDVMPGRYVTLEVHDTGCGMDEATMTKIFDPFFTTKFTGRGLGLAAVIGIVRRHQGALKVYSAPGRGSDFKLLFPVSEREQDALSSPRAENQLYGSGCVLVVDDEEIVRDLAKSALERYGYNVLLANDGQQAIDIVYTAAGEISLILLDLTMPTMGGDEALANLQSMRPSTRILLTSGFNDVEALGRVNGKSIAGFIQKPYTARQLVEKVAAVLAEPSSHLP